MNKKIKNVIKFRNGMVMVFDKSGKQMPAYQGIYENVRDKINKATDEETTFEYADNLAAERTSISNF